MRASGILLPVFSLPSEYGVGDFYRGAYDFIEKLKRSGQRYWQILPIGPTGEDNCPYQAISSFAIDPVFISPERLLEKGLLTSDEAARAEFVLRVSSEGTRIDYVKVKREKHELLKRAYDRYVPEEAFHAFCFNEKEWLDDYALFMALSQHFGTFDIRSWDDDLRTRKVKAMAEWSRRLSEDTGFHRWIQYEAYTQWQDLLDHAHDNGVEIIGDLPYFVAYESADLWTRPDLFRLDGEGNKVFVAGAPPDAFSQEGQCWGNPVYEWQACAKEQYSWWKKRIAHQFRLFDVVRLDHMRGFESYYCIPEETEAPKDGHWEKGPGMDLFDSVKAECGDLRLIAEDLGYLTEEVRAMMDACGFPGMKILQFAFDTGEENLYLPGNYVTDNSVVYTGTHDNDTTLGWYESIGEEKKRFVSWYLTGDGESILPAEEAARGLIGLAMSTRCDTCIIPMQDYLLLGSGARINVPGKAEDNWGWRMEEDAFSEVLCQRIRDLTEANSRITGSQ